MAVVATILTLARVRIERPNAHMARRGFFLAPEHGPRVVLESRTRHEPRSVTSN